LYSLDVVEIAHDVYVIYRTPFFIAFEYLCRDLVFLVTKLFRQRKSNELPAV
jgi:hypothetical protein